MNILNFDSFFDNIKEILESEEDNIKEISDFKKLKKFIDSLKD